MTHRRLRRSRPGVAFWVLAFLVAGPLFLAAPVARAVEPDEILEDPALEARARDLSKGLRCLVCRNQSIDDSNAGLARDLRLVVRERLVAGDSDAAVIDFVVDRYGSFVLLEPPVTPETAPLWYGPPLLLLAGLIGVGLFLFRRRGPSAAPESFVGTGATPSSAGDARMKTVTPLSEEEERRLAALLEDE